MKHFLFLFFLSFSSLSFSQIWCRTGAVWYYTHYSPSASLYTRHTYLKDTVLSGKNCNKIEYYTQGFGMFGPASSYGNPYYTYVNGNVIYLLDQSTSNFDTLFYFGASIGDKWKLAPKSMSNCNNSIVNVIDTGHYIIQSQKLKWIYVQVNAIANFGPYSFNDTLIERIGCRSRYFYFYQDICQTLWDQEKGGPLRCYSDDQILNYKYNFSQACNYYYTGMPKNNLKNLLRYFQTPRVISSILKIIFREILN
jgi:hypothetical protein